MVQYVIGLDMSLRSPGIAIKCCVDNTWTLLCMAQRKRELQIKSKKLTDRVTLDVFEPCPDSDDTLRYIYIVETIIKKIQQYTNNSSEVAFVLEGYAIGMRRKQGYTSKLHELGGCLKMQLYKQFKATPSIYAPTKWKRLFVNRAFADKVQVYNAACKSIECPDLAETFGLKIQNEKYCPNPVQDLTDAVGLVEAYIKINDT